MRQCQVTRTRKARDGDILALCGLWGHTDKFRAIQEIKWRWVRYFVRERFGQEVDVVVVPMGSAEYLRTSRDLSLQNNLEFLPDC